MHDRTQLLILVAFQLYILSGYHKKKLKQTEEVTPYLFFLLFFSYLFQIFLVLIPNASILFFLEPLQSSTQDLQKIIIDTSAIVSLHGYNFGYRLNP